MKKRAGVTLIELLITLALVSFIFVGVVNLFLITTKTHAKSLDEFNVQSTVRIISQSVNGIIRDSSGIFLLDKEYPDDSVDLEAYLTESWNYLMLNGDKTKLIEWVWNDDTKEHKERIVIDAFQNVSYDLVYNKESAANEDRLLGYTLDVNVNGQKRIITSELEGVNTLQIIDRSYGGIPNTLAYREDSRLTDIAIAQAAVSFVIDKSGSMSDNLSPGKSKMTVLKEEATKMVEGLSEYENIWLSISPFATTANSDTGDKTNEMFKVKANIDTFINDNDSIIKKLSTGGGTNTGDGMRRGLSTIVKFNEESDNQDKITKNFMIILVDGDTTYATATERINNEYRIETSSSSHSPEIILNAGTENERVYNYVRTTSSGFLWWVTYTHYYSCACANHTTYYTLLHENVGKTSAGLQENVYEAKGKVVGNGSNYDTNYGKPYVDIIGDMIKEYRNTRDDGIDVFIIGFSTSATPTGLQDLANATKSIHGTHGGTYKYYKADTAEALETVLNEIKFQISDALWHIGGPN